MRPVFLILLGPLFRTPALPALAHARKILPPEYPSCPRRREFSYFPAQFSPAVPMADLSAESKEEVERLPEPCDNEAELLGKIEAPEEALESKKEEEGSAEPVEEKLPKLSAADFKIYNNMAEHMDYFVGVLSLLTLNRHPPLARYGRISDINQSNSTTTSANPGTSFTRAARLANGQHPCP